MTSQNYCGSCGAPTGAGEDVCSACRENRKKPAALAAGFLGVLTLAVLVTVVAVFRPAPAPEQWELHCAYVDDFNTYRCQERVISVP